MAVKGAGTIGKQGRTGAEKLTVLFLFFAVALFALVTAASADIVNTATATANYGSVTVTSAPVTVNVPVATQQGALSLDKTATLNDGGDGIAHAGDTISYSFLVTNTGPVSLTNVTVSDPLVDFAVLEGRAEALSLMAAVATGADPMMTASAPAPKGDFLGSGLGRFAPVATERIARAYPGRTVPELAVALHVKRELVLLSGDVKELKPGDEVAIYYDLTNTGEGPLTGITVEQQGAEAFGNALEVLPPNTTDSASVIFVRTLTAEDVAAGTFSLPGIVRAKSRGRSQKFAVADDLSFADMNNLQQLVTATITPASVPLLAPTESTVFTATYTLTQADVDAGQIVNTAQASATTAGGAPVTVIDSVTTILAPVPGIALIKTSTLNPGGDGIANPGDSISYSFAIRNTGNVTLSNIAITDPNATVAGGPLLLLAPGVANSSSFSASHVLTQADIDAGEVQNHATVTASTPAGGSVSDLSDDDSETEDEPTITPLTPDPGISLIKQGTVALGADNMATAGDLITYSFAVRNTGNVTLNNVTVVDPPLVVNGGPLTALAAGQTDSSTFTVSYILTQADIDAGQVSNQAQASGTPGAGAPVTDLSDDTSETEDDPTVLTLVQQPGIGLLKAVSAITDANGNSVTDEGDTLTYAFTIVNTGNVTLSNVSLSDNNATVVGGPLTTLAPGMSDTATFIASHVVTAQDVAAGRVSNQATVTAQTPAGRQVSDLSDTSDLTEDDPTVTPTAAMPRIALIKRVTGIVNTNGNGLVDAGDTIEYAFEVHNTGNVTLTGITLADPLPNTVVNGGPITQMDAGDTDTTTFTASYVLTSADITAGQVTNQATVSGSAPDTSVIQDDSDESSLTGDDATITQIANAPAVALIKTVASVTDSNGNNIDDAGDVIHYAFAVTNTGNVDLTNLTLTDTLATPSGGPIPTLAVGATDTTTFTATRIITQADVDAGGVFNQGRIDASLPPGRSSSSGNPFDLSDNNSLTEDQPTFYPLSQVPGVALVKTVQDVDDVNHNGINDVGDVITYGFAIHNIGNTTLGSITLTDNNAVIQNGVIPDLLPGDVYDAVTATHEITEADAAAGEVVNTAEVSGMAPGDVLVEDISDESDIGGSDPTVLAVEQALPVLTKTAARTEIRRGETARYTITASNLADQPYDITDVMPPVFEFVQGSAVANGTAVTPTLTGQTLTFANLQPVNGKIVITLQMIAPVTANTGKVVNRAQLINPATGSIIARADAVVTIKEEHVFDCGDLIGRVFDDKNANGYADDDEAGLPGVRVVTVKGLLVTTDKKGRFHVPCADVPDAAIGSNFLMKLDTRTLPEGYRLTTENPRDVRLTRGKVTKLNFGAARERAVQLDLRKDAFASNSTELLPKWYDGIERLVGLLEENRGTLAIVYRCGQYAPIADERLEVVTATVRRRWAARGNDEKLVINARVECGK